MSISREHLMSLTEADFFRILPVAVAPCEYRKESDTVIVRCGQGRVQIRLTPEPPRRIASLTFPVLKVAIEFHDMPLPESQQFLDRFDRAFHRGGG